LAGVGWCWAGLRCSRAHCWLNRSRSPGILPSYGASNPGHPAASPPRLPRPRARFESEISRRGGKRTARHRQGMSAGVARSGAAPSARRSAIGLPAAFKSHARRRWRLQQRASTPKAESKPGPRVTFESEVRMTGAGTFIESGRITYGKAGGKRKSRRGRWGCGCNSSRRELPPTSTGLSPR
jgi:hypothetical protein